MDRFTLNQVERITGIPENKLAYWLKEFPELRALAHEEGEIYLDYDGLGLVLRLELLLERSGYTIAGARRQLALGEAPEPDRRRLIERILVVRAELEQLRQIFTE